MSEEKNSTQRAMEIVLALASENIIFISEHYREEVLEAIERVELVAEQLARESKIRHDSQEEKDELASEARIERQLDDL